MIAAAIIASLSLGPAAQYYFGDVGGNSVICGIWIALYLWRTK